MGLYKKNTIKNKIVKKKKKYQIQRFVCSDILSWQTFITRDKKLTKICHLQLKKINHSLRMMIPSVTNFRLVSICQYQCSSHDDTRYVCTSHNNYDDDDTIYQCSSHNSNHDENRT